MGISHSKKIWRIHARERDTWRRCWGEGALASASANGSQCWESIPPLGSAILTPLSDSLLWEAVIMRPINEESILSDLRAAKIPTLYTVDWSNPASALKPAVPYESLTPVPKPTIIDSYIYIYIYQSQFSIFYNSDCWGKEKKERRKRDLEEEGSERRSWGGETVAVPSCFLLELESESERDEDQFQEVSVVMDSMILSEETVATQPSICFSYCSFTKTLRFYLRLFLFYSLTYQKKKKKLCPFNNIFFFIIITTPIQ